MIRLWDSSFIDKDERGLSVLRRGNDPERIADNMANCSCFIHTANKRKNSGPSRQELRQMLREFDGT